MSNRLILAFWLTILHTLTGIEAQTPATKINQIKECLIDKAIPENVRIDVTVKSKEFCSFIPLEFRGVKSFYELSKSEHGLIIRLRPKFTFVGPPKIVSSAKGQLQAALDCAKRFYRTQGFLLNVIPSHIQSSKNPEIKISSFALNRRGELVAPLGLRSDAGNFIFTFEQDKDCGMMIHELAHHFGLPDKYPDEMCPGRKISENLHDIMRSPRLGKYVSPRDIAKIIKPLCNP